MVSLGLGELLDTEYRRNVVILPLLAFTVNLGFGAVSAIIPYFLLYLVGALRELPEEIGMIGGASRYAVEFGVLMALFMLTRAFLARFFGIYSDRAGRKRIIVAGVALYALISFLYVVVPSLEWLYAIRALQGVASAMVWPVAEALLIDSVPPTARGRAMGLYMAATTFSFIGGPALGVAVYKVGVYTLGIRSVDAALRFPFLVIAAAGVATIFLSLLLQEAYHPRPRRPGDKPPRIAGANKRSVEALYVIGFANGVGMGLVAPFMLLYLVEFVTSDPAAIAYVTLISGIAGVLATYPAGYLSDKIGRRALIAAGILASRTTTILIPFARTVESLTAVATARSIAFNAYTPAFRALQADLVPEELRGRVFGTVQMFFNIGAVVGPLVGGPLYRMYAERNIGPLPGVAVSFLVSALLGYIALVIFLLYVREPERGEGLRHVTTPHP